MDQAPEPDAPSLEQWDDAVASGLPGKSILVGLTHVRGEEVLRQEQFHGIVVSVDRKRGVKLMLRGIREGEEYNLPPQTSNFEPARPGEYRLRTSGEVVIDPDYVSTWTVEAPKPAA